jgi:hypothetical protein
MQTLIFELGKGNEAKRELLNVNLLCYAFVRWKQQI